MWCKMLFRTSLSSSVERMQRSDMGLYVVGSVGVLFGYSIGMIFVIFQLLAMLLFVNE